MVEKTGQPKDAKRRVRNLRRARKYIAGNQGALARLLNTYAAKIAEDPQKAYLPEA